LRDASDRQDERAGLGDLEITVTPAGHFDRAAVER
jgi:hypothetical protein